MSQWSLLLRENKTGAFIYGMKKLFPPITQKSPDLSSKIPFIGICHWLVKRLILCHFVILSLMHDSLSLPFPPFFPSLHFFPSDTFSVSLFFFWRWAPPLSWAWWAWARDILPLPGHSYWSPPPILPTSN